ncbi:MAG: hypothetical protein KTR14_03135 [Vampirovibrio sp.]|nr:hypothetical protein [Vampirovibrio sp.]
MQQDKLAQYLGKQYAKSLMDAKTSNGFKDNEDSIIATMNALAHLNKTQMMSIRKSA